VKGCCHTRVLHVNMHCILPILNVSLVPEILFLKNIFLVRLFVREINTVTQEGTTLRQYHIQLSYLLCLSAHAMSGVWAVMNTCVWGIGFDLFSDVFLLDYELFQQCCMSCLIDWCFSLTWTVFQLYTCREQVKITLWIL
jgi:hypothetical protein